MDEFAVTGPTNGCSNICEKPLIIGDHGTSLDPWRKPYFGRYIYTTGPLWVTTALGDNALGVKSNYCIDVIGDAGQFRGLEFPEAGKLKDVGMEPVSCVTITVKDGGKLKDTTTTDHKSSTQSGRLAPHHIRVPLQRRQACTGRHVPHLERLVARRRHDAPPVRKHRNAIDLQRTQITKVVHKADAARRTDFECLCSVRSSASLDGSSSKNGMNRRSPRDAVETALASQIDRVPRGVLGTTRSKNSSSWCEMSSRSPAVKILVGAMLAAPQQRLSIGGAGGCPLRAAEGGLSSSRGLPV